MSTKIVMIPIDKVVPYEKNPRLNAAAVAPVAESIRLYGFKQPIVVDKNYVVVAGHTRLLAAQELGYAEVPCIVSELDDEKNRAYRLVDNRTAENAAWDIGKLSAELEGLDFGGFDFGWDLRSVFEETDIDRFFDSPSDESADTQEDATAVFGIKIFCNSEEEAQEMLEEYTLKGYEVDLL